MAKIWARIHETIDRHGIAGLVSVIDSAGSVPRESGARSLVEIRTDAAETAALMRERPGYAPSGR